MGLKLEPAIKYVKPLKLFMYGPSFAGKTYSALEIAAGTIMETKKCTEQEAYKHIAVIDSEYGRASLHRKKGPFNHIIFKRPYHIDRLRTLFMELEAKKDIFVVVLDSFTHFWVKEGGILSQKHEVDKQGGNSYTNWQEFTDKFNQCIDDILESDKHYIVTARAIPDRVLEANEKGKMVPKTYGLKPEMRAGIEYEFDIAFNIDKDTHELLLEKGIPGMDKVYPAATTDTGKMIYNILTEDAVVPSRSIEDYTNSIRSLAKQHNLVTFIQLKLSGRKLEDMSLEDLTQLEDDIIKEIKANQVKRNVKK